LKQSFRSSTLEHRHLHEYFDQRDKTFFFVTDDVAKISQSARPWQVGKFRSFHKGALQWCSYRASSSS
jgi:hypothetical protein